MSVAPLEKKLKAARDQEVAASAKVQKATVKMQERQQEHREAVEKFLADDEKNRAAVDAAQAKLNEAAGKSAALQAELLGVNEARTVP